MVKSDGVNVLYLRRKFMLLVIYMQDEVNKLISTTLGEREREIIRLYYGLDKECLTWEDISKRLVKQMYSCLGYEIGLI